MKFKSLYIYILFTTFSFGQQSDYYKQITYEITKAESQFNDKAYSAVQNSARDILSFQKPNAVIANDLTFKKVVADLVLQEKYALEEYEKYANENPEIKQEYSLYEPLGNFYLINGQYENSAYYLSKVLPSDFNEEEKINHYYKLGYAYFMSEEYQKALSPLKKVNKANHYKNETDYMIGHILYHEGKYAQVMNYFEPLLNHENYSQKVRPYLIQIYFNDKKYNQAIEEGKKLLNSGAFPEMKSEISKIIGESYFKLQEYKQAIPYLENYIDSQENPKASDFYQLGYVYYVNGNYQKAVDNFNKITSENSELGQNAYYQLGNSYLKTNKKQEALTAYKSASEMNFNAKVAENAHYNYAKLSFDIGNPFESTPNAIQRFLDNYPKNPHQAKMNQLLVKSYVKSNQLDDAVNILKTKSNKSPELKNAYQEVSYLNGVRLFNEGKYQQAIDNFKHAIEITSNQEVLAKSLFWSAESNFQLGNYTETLLNLKTLEKININYSEKIQLPYLFGFTYLKVKNYEKSVEYFERFLNNPTKELEEDAKLRLADAYLGLNNYDKAIAIYDTAEETENSEYATFQRANLYGLQGKQSEKIKTLQDYIQNYPNSDKKQTAYYEIANAYYSLQKYNDAISYYDKVISMDKQNEILTNSYFARADSYAQLNQDERAINEYKSIAKKYAQTDYVKRAVSEAQSLYVKTGNVKGFESWIKSINYSITNQEKEEFVFAVAQKSFSSQKYQQTINDLTGFDINFPKSTKTTLVNFYLAESYYQLKQLEKAIPYFTKVAGKPNENQEEALLRLSQIYLNQNKKDEAFLSLEALYQVSNNPNYLSFCELELMHLYAEKKQYKNAVEMANKVISNDTNSQTIKETAKVIIAKSELSLGEENKAKELYKELENSSNEAVKAESLYYKAYFLNKDKKYKESNEVIFNLVSNYSEQQYWGAKSLVVMSENYFYLNDLYQANYTINQVLENYTEYSDIIEEANKVKKKF
ncbi:MAG: tetratricopeptide repeat protein [Flavobacteriales bacterium]|nr:tetratricopeptide repeat protein [Flavobacteriales bacterium]